MFPGAHGWRSRGGASWHGVPDHYVAPALEATFWAQKLAENVEPVGSAPDARDSSQQGGKVVRILGSMRSMRHWMRCKSGWGSDGRIGV